MSKSVIIIPSRLASTRLLNKPLIKINNKSLIMHVYEKAVKSKVGEVFVATCDEQIALEVKKNKGNFIMTNISHKNGTERVCEASKKLKLEQDDYVINVQGDEPMINSYDIKNLNDISKLNNLDMSTLAFDIQNIKDLKNKNIVKVITENKISSSIISKALTFKRKIQNIDSDNIYHHCGVYLYKASILEKLVNFNQTKNEKIENLEQLRALDNRIIINVILADHFSVGIDTLEDLNQFTKLINNIK